MAMLFADAVNFSKLTEQQIPLFLNHFLGAIGKLISTSPHAPSIKNTWGDGLYFVFADVRDAGLFALDLCELMVSTDWSKKGLPKAINLRIALHAGPVYSCVDPVTGQASFTGTHVSRAARIEPITPPGQVYASQAFAALSAAQGVKEFTCDYVGQTPLAKGYGTFATYHVRDAHSRSQCFKADEMNNSDFKYWAFISYSHADEEWAKWLHKSIETYRVPRKIVGRETPQGQISRRLFPVFRDREELPGASDLGGKLQDALTKSRSLIIICSPKSAVSKWVNEEVKTYKSFGHAGRVFCLITDGEPNRRAG